MTICARLVAVLAFAAAAFASLAARDALAVSVPPLPLPGPYAVECSNVAQDLSRLAPGEQPESYWEGIRRANGTARSPIELLIDPANTPMVTVDAPNNRQLFGTFAGRSFTYVVVICHPTTTSNPRPDYQLPTDRPIPHMIPDGEAPLWPDATTRFPILLFSHGYGDAPISSDYLYAMTVFASFGYVVAAPFHTDAAFSDLRKLDGVLDFVFLVTHLEQFTAMQALRPLALSKTLDYLLADPLWRDRVDASEVGGFGASMGAESLLLMGGGKLTTTVTQQSMPVTFDPRLKAVGYVPYLGQIGFNAFGESQHGLDDVTLSFLAISGTADMTAPITETLRGIERLAGPRELVALAGVGHEFDRPAAPDIFTWAVTYFDSEVRRDPAARAKLVSMTSVMGGADDHVLVPYNGPATIPAPVVNYQGMWWNPLESGWGIDLAHQGDVIFAAWFTYDFTGAALPLTATLRKVAPGVYTGTLIRTSGPPFSAAPWVPAAVTRMEVGTATVAFANGNAATFAFTVNDGGRTTTQTKAITRQVFRAPGTVCG